MVTLKRQSLLSMCRMSLSMADLLYYYIILYTISGTGFEIPDYAKNSLQMQGVPGAAQVKPQVPATTTQAPPIATQCFMLSNMFDPTM